MTDGDNRDDTIILRVEVWAVRGETMPRLALHVHGDRAAFAAREQIVEAFRRLAEDAVPGPNLDLAELDAAVRLLGSELGLTGYAGECKCRRDPLHTIVDASLYTPSE